MSPLSVAKFYRSRLERHFSILGLILGTTFFALSLTPSLLPRTDLIQGLLSGFSLAAGYGVAIFFIWLWNWLGLPRPRKQAKYYFQFISAAICLIAAIIFLYRASSWQNTQRVMMGMEETAGIQPLVIGAIALIVFLLLLLIARLFIRTYRFLTSKLKPYVPARLSHMLGLVAALLLFWSVADGVLFSALLRMADASYQQYDARMEPQFSRPEDPMKAGSSQSLLNWQDLGYEGRRFLSGAPDAGAIGQHTSGQTFDPIRVYVGMNAAETYEQRALLALEELIRTGAFERSLLVVITPTGTGWVDPAGILPLEYLHRGDIASVAAQYSYLPSALSLLVEDEYGTEMARALLREVYRHWTSLPANDRPRLYLYGLSLGALNSDRSFDLYDIINDPFHGILWSGPPFRQRTWRSITDQRNPGSPEWLPQFRDGSVVRFANQYGGLERDEIWGRFRIAFLQYASDPITFFNPAAFTREPDWMKSPRGPDVTPDLQWYPIVTMLQLAADMIGGSPPRGYGHEYAAVHYFDSWVALTDPQGWSSDELTKLRAFFEKVNPL